MRWCNAAGQVVASGDGGQVPNGSISSWTVPPGALADGPHTWTAVGHDLLEAGPASGTGRFTVDATAPTDPSAVRIGPPHDRSVQSDDRTIDISWTPGQDSGSGLAGHDVLFTHDATAPTDEKVPQRSASPRRRRPRRARRWPTAPGTPGSAPPTVPATSAAGPSPVRC